MFDLRTHLNSIYEYIQCSIYEHNYIQSMDTLNVRSTNIYKYSIYEYIQSSIYGHI